MSYAHRSFENASLINSCLFIYWYFLGYSLTRVYVLGCANFYGLVLLADSFLGLPMVIPILFTPVYPSPGG